MARWQWEWRGWWITLTIGGSIGLGFMVIGRYWSNGVDIYFGPIILTIVPPQQELNNK